MEGHPPKEPYFDLARGAADAAVLVPPPFAYPGTSARVFPLAASMDILRSFCDQYLNVGPPEVAVFRPALPYVILAVLDYGHMALESENLGWVAQHEIYFGIPVEKWRLSRGRMIFEGWLLNAPFIFVDNAASLTTGREVYGWNKTLASLRPRLQGWLADPRKPIRFLTVSVKGYGPRDAEKIRLLEVNQRLSQNPSFAPADLATVDPFQGISQSASGAALIAGNLMDLLLHPPLAGFAPRGGYRKSDAQILLEGLSQLFGFLTNPGLNVITLKQFRDARDTNDICYQALVESRLAVTRFNHGGPLGLCNLLLGDITGGFRIHLHDNPAFPIVSSLGLQVARQRKLGGNAVSTLEPFFPFWISVDLTYNRGVNLAWRMLGSPWHDSRGAKVPSGRRNWSYNTVAGGAEQEWVSPLVIPKATVDVFPLRVHDRRRLALFVHEYLNHHGEPDTFEPWGGHVYMVSSRSRIFSQAQSSAVCEVAFYVPLLWKQNGRLKGVAVAKPYSFVDDPNFAMTLREVQGVPAMDATIVTPRHSWLRQELRRRGRQEPVLRVKAAVFTLLEAGLRSKNRTVIEVLSQGLPAPMPALGDSLGPEVGDQLLKMGNKVLSGQANLQVLTLKQFRDAKHPNRACYQSLVLEPWTLFRRLQPEPLGAGTRVRLYRYPSLPLAVPLGLIHPPRPPKKLEKELLADVLTPDHPFRIELNVYMGCSEVLYRTAGNLPWVKVKVKAKAKGRDVQPSRETIEEIERFHEVFLGGPQLVIQALLRSSGAEAEGKSGRGAA
jgi:hypothetical protein